MKKSETIKRLSAIEEETKQLRKIIEEAEKPIPIIDRLFTFEDALSIKGVRRQDVLPYPMDVDSRKDAINALSMIDLIISLCVEDWIPNWNDTDQKKWYPIFDMRNSFGFSRSNCNCWNADSFVSSRLCFPTKEMSNTIAKRFEHIYKLLYVKQ